jgi:isopentenyldiphosphate isomerase
MAVRDSDGKLLLLQRGTQLKTCAGTWGFLGEHMHTGEDPQTAVKRALDEELGTQIRQHHVASLFNVSTLWYTQVYDDGRSERQVSEILRKFQSISLSQRGICFIDADFCGFFRRHTSGPCNLDTLLEMLCCILMMR